MALHKGSVSFPLACVYRGCRLPRKEEDASSAFCHVPRQMAMPSHGFLGNNSRAAELIAARRAVEQGFKIPDKLLHMQSKSEATWAQEKHVGTGGCAVLSPVLKRGEQELS